MMILFGIVFICFDCHHHHGTCYLLMLLVCWFVIWSLCPDTVIVYRIDMYCIYKTNRVLHTVHKTWRTLHGSPIQNVKVTWLSSLRSSDLWSKQPWNRFTVGVSSSCHVATLGATTATHLLYSCPWRCGSGDSSRSYGNTSAGVGGTDWRVF